jgi:hypothetical protein
MRPLLDRADLHWDCDNKCQDGNRDGESRERPSLTPAVSLAFAEREWDKPVVLDVRFALRPRVMSEKNRITPAKIRSC